MHSPIKAENKKLAEGLRRLADSLENSDRMHHWCLRASASEPVSVTAALLDDPSGITFSPIRTGLFIGDEGFVSRMKEHFDSER